VIAVVAIGASFFVPEVRQFFHLEKRPQAAPAIETPSPITTTASQSAPAPKSPEPTKPGRSKPPKTQRTTQGNSNVAGSNISGDNNVTGNNNQVAPTANAPNGIAITGGTVTDPTVNNFGPPALQITWSVLDTQPQGKFSFAKAVTVKTNVYPPVHIAIFCAVDVDDVSPTGVSMGLTIT